jgi:uncharacterized membrane protein
VSQLAGIVERLGCHQIPERCLIYRGAPMRLCARCVGVALGQVLAAVIFLCGVRVSVAVCAVGPVVMLLDWGAQEYGGRMSNNRRRLVTGAAAGFGLGILYCRLGLGALRFILATL